LAEASGLSPNKVKSYRGSLVWMEIVEKKPHLKTLREFVSDDELDSFLEEYEARSKRRPQTAGIDDALRTDDDVPGALHSMPC